MASSFVDAAACGDIDDIKRLLDLPTTSAEVINAPDKDGRCALHYSCLNDDVTLLGILLEDERVDIAKTTPNQESIFHLAALYSALRVLKLLTENDRTKGLINAKNKYKETPLHLVAGSGDKNAVKTATLLLSNGADLTALDNWNRSPFHCSRQNLETELVSFFENYLKTQSKEIQNRIQEITVSLEKEKQNDLKEKQKGNKELKNNFLATFNQLKVSNKNQLNKVTTVEKNIFKPELKQVSNNEKRHSLNKEESKKKVLSKLIDFPGDLEQIKQLISDPEVELNGKDSFGVTALMKFASWNKIEYMDLLLPKLSDSDLNSVDVDGKTALFWAVECASIQSVKYLVKLEGIRTDIKDKKNRDVFDLCDSAQGQIKERLRKALNGE